MADQKLLKVADVVRRLQLGKTKIYELIATGELEAVKIGDARRVPEEAVDDFIAKRRAEAKATA